MSKNELSRGNSADDDQSSTSLEAPPVSDSVIKSSLDQRLRPDNRENYENDELGLIATLMANPNPTILTKVKEALLEDPSATNADTKATRVLLQAMEINRRRFSKLNSELNNTEIFALSKQMLEEYLREGIAISSTNRIHRKNIPQYHAALQVLADPQLSSHIKNTIPWQDRVREINQSIADKLVNQLNQSLNSFKSANKARKSKKLGDLTRNRFALENAITKLEKAEKILSDNAHTAPANPLEMQSSQVMAEITNWQDPPSKSKRLDIDSLKGICEAAKKSEGKFRETLASSLSVLPADILQNFFEQNFKPSQAQADISARLEAHSKTSLDTNTDALSEAIRVALSLTNRDPNKLLPPGAKVDLPQVISAWRKANVLDFKSLEQILVTLEIGAPSPDVTAVLVMPGRVESEKVLVLAKRGAEIIFIDPISRKLNPPIVRKLLSTRRNNSPTDKPAFFMFRMDSKPNLHELTYAARKLLFMRPPHR